MSLHIGIYEQIVNRLFRAKLDMVDTGRYFIGTKSICKEDAIRLLSRYLQHLFESAFATIKDEDDSEKFIRFVNDIIVKLGREFNIEDCNDNLIDAGRNILTAVIDKTKCDYPDIEQYIKNITPETTLSRSVLFCGGAGSTSMNSELNREILSADEICWVISFIKCSGLNLLWKSLRQFTSEGKNLRIITTTYTCATEYEAISKLASLPNTKIKISYDGSKDRLHAKAYIFLRNSGFHTAYIGSSNLSGFALKDGKEWNFKATQFELPQVIESVRNSFESYWNDETFEDFIPGVSDERLKRALNMTWEDPLLDFSALDLMRAKDYQQEILEKLDVERNVHNHFKNLVVAATGTGKTVIAAYDFKRFKESHPNCHFLFIAHRQEILRQSITTFRTVLGDPNFGDLWDGNNEPRSYQNVFASKDTLRNRIDSLTLSKTYYQYIIIDEVHHVVAPTYVKLVTYFKPDILLGLTATPERTNTEEDITVFFDGHISAEIRLPAALNAGLLAPFHYYGIPDNTDLTEVKWNGHGYDPSELTRIYTQNDYRTGLILNKMVEYLGASNLHKVRALCFCVNKDHAKYMHAKFTLASLHSAVLTSDDPDSYRKLVQKEFRSGKVNYLFVVDLFNEGVDIPEIDTILFLRPTESCTVFLQQFGRGLRKHEGKDHLTVLDFVGHSRAEFSYKDRFEALIGRHSRSITDEINGGFTNAPFGCTIMLEEKAKEEILANIEGFIKSIRKDRIIQEIETFHKVSPSFSLSSFLDYSHIPLHKIYNIMTWGEFCRQADIEKEVSAFSQQIKYAVSNKWLATDSYSYFTKILEFAEAGFKIDVGKLTDKDKRLATMFYYDLYERSGNFPSIQAMFNSMAQDMLFIREIQEVVTWLRERCSAPEKEDNSVFCEWNPLKLHGIYTKAQIQAALGFSTFDRKSSSREGVERLKELRLEAMFVDVIKKREEGSTTDYKDFAMGKRRFHWETQSTVSSGSPTAEAYRTKANHQLLFVRQQQKNPDTKATMGFVYLGEVELVSMEGSKPIQIVWDLKSPMSEATYAFASQYKAIN